MRNTIKNKTELRYTIKNAIGNTDSLDYVEFYQDWTWDIMGCNTWTTNDVCYRCQLSELAWAMDWESSVDETITEKFRDLESHIISWNQATKEHRRELCPW